MTDTPKLPQPLAVLDAAEVLDATDFYAVKMPTGMTIMYSKTESTISTHRSISPELMTASVQQSNAQVKIAEARYVTPAVEKSKQVKTAGYAAVATVALGVLGAIARPEAATQIAAMVAVVATIFGGAFAVGELRKKPTQD